MSATSGGGGSVSDGSEAGGSSHSTMSVSDSPSTSFQNNLTENVTKITLSEENIAGGYGIDMSGSRVNLALDERQQKDGIVNVAFDFEEGMNYAGSGTGSDAGGGSGVGGTVGFGTGVGIAGGIGAGIGAGMASGGGTGGAAGASVAAGAGGVTGAGSGVGAGGAGEAGGVAGAGSGIGAGGVAGAGSAVVGGGAGVGSGSGGGVEFKLINGSEKKEKVPEAVNLELVNMVPYSNGNGTSYGVPVNGIPMKKDSEQVDMSSPYDEYFVPVNEHKKYMRGEKLYVTKDKRRPTSWRRCLSWVVACTVISVVLIVAILAGTGVILSEPNLVKEASVGRNFAGSNVKPSVTDKSPTPTAEMLMYVPRSIESEFVIDNLKFDPALKDVNSTAYQEFTSSMEDHLKMLLFDRETLDFEASDVALKIVNVSHDPFKVNYRIGWNYKEGANNPPEPIKMEDVKKRLVESLARNQGYIDKYHIDREAIKVNNIVNACQIENGGCSHICYYNYVTQQFTCTCPTHLVLDGTGKNCVAWTGSSEDDAVPVPSHTAYPEMPYESTVKPSQDHDFGARYEHGVHHQQENQQEPVPEPDSNDREPAAEPEPTAEPSQDHDEGSFYSKSEQGEGVHSVHDVHHETAPDPATEANSEDKYHGHRQSVHGYIDAEEEAEPTPEPAPEPTAEPNYEGKDHIASWQDSKDHEPAAEPTPEPAPEPTAEDSSKGRSHDSNDHSVYVLKDHEPAAEPTPEPAAEPTAEPHPEGEDRDPSDHSVYGSKDHEPAAEPTPEPTPEFGSESKDQDHGRTQGQHHSVYGFKDESSSEPAPEPTGEENKKDHEVTTVPNSAEKSRDTAIHSVYEIKDHESAAEPTPEPSPEPTAEENEKGHEADNSTHELRDHEVGTESNPTGESRDNTLHTAYESKEHEPEAEPLPEPTAEPNADGKDHDQANHSLHGSKDQEPTPEPTAEPAAEPTAEPGLDGKNHDLVNHSLNESDDHEPAAEPSPEPTPEPTAEHSSNGKDHDLLNHSPNGSKDQEPAAEPTPEPTPEPTAEHGSDRKDHDLVNHSLYGSKDQEPAAKQTPEGTTERDTKEGQIHGSGVYVLPAQDETVAEPTAEPIPEHSSEDGAVKPESKDHEAAGEHTPEHGSDFELSQRKEDQAGAKSSEAATESSGSADDEAITRFNSGTGFHMVTTVHPIPIYERMNASVKDHQEAPSQGQMSSTITEYPVQGRETDLDMEKSERHMPHLEDILIRKPIHNPENQNATDYRQNPLDNVELKPNGEPVIEEIIIDKSVNGHGKETDMAQNPMGTGNIENTGAHPRSNSSMQFAPNNQHQSSTPEGETVVYDTATDHPRIIEYSAVDYSTKENKDGSEAQVRDSSKEKSTNTGNNQEPSQSAQNLGMEHASTSQTNQDVPITTMHPDMEHEPHTIPVTIEFLHPIEESHAKMPKAGEESPESTTHSKDTGVNEEPINHMNDTSKIFMGQTLEETKVHKTTTESHAAMTTLFPNLKPDENNSQVAGDESKENFRKSQGERGETTKAPDEISNNIKDELLDNEEFNTLLDHKYKNKETSPNDSTKYSNKPTKTEKKKIKDYVKGDKIDQKGEATPKPAVTPAEFILQKHVNGNENIFDLDYSLQNEHTTKHDGEVTVIDPHGIEVPGVSLKPHGINNHDISVLQTVAPDFRTETLIPNGAQEQESLRPDSKNKEGEPKLDKDYSKFDKDYKYEKQKVSKKKDLKKKVGGKDGKNVELEDGRKYFTEITKDDLDSSSEELPETTKNAFEKVTGEPETGVKIIPQDSTQFDKGEKTVPEGSAQAGDVTGGHETRTEPAHQMNTEADPEKNEQTKTGLENNEQTHNIPTDASGHLMVDEPIIKSTSDPSSATVHDGQGQIPGFINFGQPEIIYEVRNATGGRKVDGVPGTVFDGIPQVSGPRFEINRGAPIGDGQNATFVIYESTGPKIVTDGNITPGVINTTLIHPTIIVNGQNSNLQVDKIVRYGNATLFNPGNATIVSLLNGTLDRPDGHSFSYFSNGSAVNPTIVVRGQSGTLQGGHEIRFGNITYRTVISPENNTKHYKNSNVYRIENGSLPGTVFDGHFNPQEGHYHMFTNSSGLYVYTNVSTEPAFVIKGQSGDFGNSKAYVIRNKTSSFSNGFVGPHSVIFRNSTVFAVGDAQGAQGQGVTVQPHELNDTIQYTHQMSPSFISSGTAYKVNDYFGYISKCAAGQFQCLNGTSKRGSACISLSSKCDSINDCSDGSDELGCIENGCPGNFQCSDSTCLKRNLVCNGILDCSDGSDEKNCESWKCEFDEFQCPSGRCIPVVWQCDNKPDCDNHTDEYNCQTSCGNDEYLCPEGWCIPLTYKCNGIKECSNGEDEQLCDCSHEEFKCQTGGCVSMNQVCNGLEDCPDRSDEWDCVKIEPESNLLKIRSATGNYEPVCADNWTPKYSDEVCASLGYFSSVPIENENSSITTDTSSFYVLKNDTTAHFNKKIIVNLRKSEGNCSSGKLVEISCQEFSCGSRSMTDSSSVEARLVGGMSATTGQWPSVALLYNIRNFHSCTANVLTPRWILASYNCLKMGNKNLNEQDWKFFGGSTVFEPEKENPETRKILSIIPHPQVKFNQFLFSNDLALVEVDHSLQFTSNLGAVCLPEQEIQPRQICVTAGWGMNTPEDKAIRQQLQYLPVPTMNLTECNSTEHYSGFITNDKICAGYNSPQKSLCYNEEGAPLMCVNDRGEWELQGVLSYHSNCGRGSHPSIFSSITPVSDWIKKTIGNSFERKVLPVTKR